MTDAGETEDEGLAEHPTADFDAQWAETASGSRTSLRRADRSNFQADVSLSSHSALQARHRHALR